MAGIPDMKNCSLMAGSYRGNCCRCNVGFIFSPQNARLTVTPVQVCLNVPPVTRAITWRVPAHAQVLMGHVVNGADSEN